MARSGSMTVSAPGSLMLLGEHAVLHGHRALVCAINRRITVRLTPNQESLLRIDSSLGSYISPLDRLVDHPSFRFVLQAVRQKAGLDRPSEAVLPCPTRLTWQAGPAEEPPAMSGRGRLGDPSLPLPGGIDLKIESEFSADIGFGSSAAVTVATHAALMQWINGVEPLRDTLFAEALKTVQTVQGRGSGADVAASVFGGIVGYRIAPSFDPVQISLPLTAVYCGYKTPTPDVIQKVEQRRAADPEKYNRIYSEIDREVEAAVSCLRDHALPAFGEILNRNHRLMDEMGVNTPELQEIVAALQADPEVFGAKISGSGLGDCAIGIGYADLEKLGYPGHHLEITPAGCQYHDQGIFEY